MIELILSDLEDCFRSLKGWVIFFSDLMTCSGGGHPDESQWMTLKHQCWFVSTKTNVDCLNSRVKVICSLSLCNKCFCSSSRTTPDSTRLVSNKNPPLHWPSELKVFGGSTNCKGYERLFKTQVWQCVKEKQKKRRGGLKALPCPF